MGTQVHGAYIVLGIVDKRKSIIHDWVKAALDAAYTFFDKEVDVLYYSQSDSMRDRSPPDLKPFCLYVVH